MIQLLSNTDSAPCYSTDYLKSVSDILVAEADAIRRVAGLLTLEAVEKSIDQLVRCEGKVVVLGVGKSGIIAHKIAATLSSTGTPAIHLHASDAMHGDLGLVTAKDVVIAISNSGETEEIISLLPHLQLRKVPIVAIVGNLHSTLARNAYAVLDASIDREACPLNLAPTTSTTVALALGDALAMTLMQAKQVKAEDFAVNHPAGKLGKRLALRVKDLMHGGAGNPTAPPVASWSEIIDLIGRWNLGAVNVVDDRQVLLGIITDGDLRRLGKRFPAGQFEALTAQVIMTPNPIVVHPDMLAYNALQLMEKRASQISVLPVVDTDGKAVGLLRIHDIIGKL
ncbi:MAG: D-arabinose 5-phosphate isomerase [uncultured Cytophagales bacterium]|uniref:D-arabinose 5-phosphate isomerase n=1 Tax=uncultured Cytophagales bacterium TaxID=158755 RepID=A0A6J4JMR2_9SPHI|nr:MAG: D-arabinose 5-phosphate isomerase [uncultured Cytophagales bacterium]